MLARMLSSVFLTVCFITIVSQQVVKAQITTATIMIRLDDSPQTFQWILTGDNGRTIASASTETYSYEQAWSWLVEYVELNVGSRYELFLEQDNNGDGFSGSMELYYGRHNLFEGSEENLILRIAEFRGFSHPLVSFTARNPTPIAPTPAPNDNGWPTGAPSRCAESINYDTADPFKPRLEFKSTKAVFGDADNICTKHQNYRACTNEMGQDCQWIFLTQGFSNGVCRVDPIAVCLKNGNCECSTEDFQGGSSDGVLFHVPVSITARDISPYSNTVTYWEEYEFPPNDNPDHPQDDSFFISRVDFTGRRLIYDFQPSSLVVSESGSRTVAFKLHYLYMDLPMVGTIWNGFGLLVSIDTSGSRHHVSVNGGRYTLETPLKLWTCTQIVITDSAVYVAGVPTGRIRSSENENLASQDGLVLGPFTGELFDVRIYSETLPENRIVEIGARCAARDDPVALRKRDVIDIHYDIHGCEADANDAYGFQPEGGIQTYGSGPFSTLWLGPVLNEGEWLDVPEGSFDVEWYFQQAKIQAYMWERHYFENDMIAFVQEPYRMYTRDEQPDYSASYYNNPCRFVHQANNNWDYPLYKCCDAAKWRQDEPDRGDEGSVFDLGSIYEGGGIPGYSFVLHELFHFMHHFLQTTYDDGSTGWLAESNSEFSTAYQFPGIDTILVGFTLAYAWPLGFELDDPDSDLVRLNPHFHSLELSIHPSVRGSHYYGSWILWWFLAEHARLPHLIGQMWSISRSIESYSAGDVQKLRMLVESHGLDFGDLFGIFVAHLRTWDFKNGDIWAEKEREDFEDHKRDDPDVFAFNLDERKIAARIDSERGTNGSFVDGPQNLLPGAFAWNSLTAESVASGRVIGISIEWADGTGLASTTFPSFLIDQHRGCDNDIRFYNSMVVLHDKATGQRRYWKLKGKTPETIYIAGGNNGPVTLHLLMIPTPPADYTKGRNVQFDREMNPRPIYNYKYKVDILTTVPTGSGLTAPAVTEYGIVKFESSTPGWWPVKCTCLDDPDGETGYHCMRPTFDLGNTPVEPIALCFPGSSTVLVEDVGMVAIRDVQIGDRVLVQGGKFEPIYSIGHKSEDVTAKYLQILPSHLVISGDHMVFVEDGSAVPASSLNIGDRLIDGRKITGINAVFRRGVYAPFTPSGTIVVDGVLASSYVGFNGSGRLFGVLSFQWLSRRFETPHRIWCSYVSECRDEEHTPEGISKWVAVPQNLWRRLLEQHPFVIVIVMLPIVICFVVMQTLEFLFNHIVGSKAMYQFVLPVLALLSGYIWCGHCKYIKAHHQLSSK